LKAEELGFGGLSLGRAGETHVNKLLCLLYQGREIEHDGGVVMEGDREQGMRLEAVIRRIACEGGGEKLVTQERRTIMNTWDQRRSCRLVVGVKA
jgi:hypothetical protein